MFSIRFRDGFGRHQFPAISSHREEPWPFKRLVRFCLKDFGAEHAQNTCKGCLKGLACGRVLYITKKCSKTNLFRYDYVGLLDNYKFRDVSRNRFGNPRRNNVHQNKLPLEITFQTGSVRRAAQIYCAAPLEMALPLEWISLNGG